MLSSLFPPAPLPFSCIPQWAGHNLQHVNGISTDPLWILELVNADIGLSPLPLLHIPPSSPFLHPFIPARLRVCVTGAYHGFSREPQETGGAAVESEACLDIKHQAATSNGFFQTLQLPFVAPALSPKRVKEGRRP